MQPGTGFWFRHCPRCAHALEPGAPCPACGYRQYRSPVAVVAGILLSDGPRLPSAGERIAPEQATHVLLVRRRGTHAGAWCLPCGYIDSGEDVRAAAAREMREETGLTVDVERVWSVRSNFHDRDNQTVGIWFLCAYRAGELRPGDDADLARFFEIARPPEPLAFPTDREVLASLSGTNGCA